MDTQLITEKLVEAERLVESISEGRRGEARIAVLTALLLKGNPAALVLPNVGNLADSGRLASKFSSVRQLARITKKAGVTGDRVALALASYIQSKDGRRLTTADCRQHWDVLSDKLFATTWVLNAEGKGWLVPVEQHGERAWEVTPQGEKEFVAMQDGRQVGESENARPKIRAKAVAVKA